AKVLVADYSLIRRDFPHLRALSEGEIDAWLLESAGHIADEQVRFQNQRVSSAIDAEEPPPAAKGKKSQGRRVHRPEGYGRALVFEVEGGMLDVKGSGTIAPRPGHHQSGLLATGEALREFIYE